MNTTLTFYTQKENHLALYQLVAEQLRDGWSVDDIHDYFNALGYNIFWRLNILSKAIHRITTNDSNL